MRHAIGHFVLLGLLLCIAGASLAGEVLTYQGRLTDASDVPVADGTYSMRFRIYDAPTGGNLLWTETNPSVQTTSGMFSVKLGELTSLDLGAMGSSNLYLEVQMELSLPMTPRTLLTSSPRAAVAGKVLGDLETSPGALTIKRSDGDSTLSFRSFDNGVSLKMFDPQTDPAGRAVIELGADAASGSLFRMFDPLREPPAKTFEFVTGVALSGLSSPAFRLLNPESEEPDVIFELVATAGSGAAMGFFNQAGQVMGVEPSPFNNGISIKMFDPQPEPPGKLLEIGTTLENVQRLDPSDVGTGDTAWFKTYGPMISGSQYELINLFSTDSAAELRLGPGAPLGSSASHVSARSTSAESIVEIVGSNFGPAPAPPIVLTSSAGSARLGIGTATPSQALHVAGNICYTGTIGACSDKRFKKDILPVNHALDLVSKIGGVRYHWRTDEYPEQHFSNGTQIGLIAQDVKHVLPEVVMEQPDGSLAIDYGRLTPVLLEAIKELKKQNDELSARMEKLEKQIR